MVSATLSGTVAPAARTLPSFAETMAQVETVAPSTTAVSPQTSCPPRTPWLLRANAAKAWAAASLRPGVAAAAGAPPEMTDGASPEMTAVAPPAGACPAAVSTRSPHINRRASSGSIGSGRFSLHDLITDLSLFG
jgi:hypothetical protein